LGAALLWSIWDYATGIIGIPVLAVLFSPLYMWLVKRGIPSGAAALGVTLLGLVLLVVPGMLIAGLLIGQAQQIAGTVLQSPIIARFSTLQVQGIPIGPRIAEAGGRIVAAIGSSAFGLVGTATRLTLNLTISFFGLYYVLKHPGDMWLDARPYIPFSKENTEKLGKRFKDVTISTVIGTGAVAAIQGLLLGLAFVVAGLPNALFWGVVTMAFAILPAGSSGAGYPARDLGCARCRERGQLHPAADLPPFLRGAPPHHADRRDWRRGAIRAPRPAHRSARVELFLRADSDVSRGVSRRGDGGGAVGTGPCPEGPTCCDIALRQTSLFHFGVAGTSR
jgi:hypothetical protein